jgi:hypothetical protein
VFLTLQEVSDRLDFSLKRVLECVSYGMLTPMVKGKDGLAPVENAADKAGLLLGEGRYHGESDIAYEYKEYYTCQSQEESEQWRFFEDDCKWAVLRLKHKFKPKDIDEKRCVFIREAIASLNLDPQYIKDEDKEKIRKWCQRKDSDLFVSPTSKKDGSYARFKRAWRYGRKKGYWSDGH